MNVDGELLQTYFHYVLRNSITVPGISVAYRSEKNLHIIACRYLKIPFIFISTLKLWKLLDTDVI